MKKIFIVFLIFLIAAFTLSACGTEASVMEVSVDGIKDEKLKQMIELLDNKNGAHIYVAEEDYFYLFLNASNPVPDSKPVEFGGLTVSYEEDSKVLVLDYVEKEAANEENIKNKVLYRIPVKEKPNRLKLLKNGQETPITTLGS